MNVEFRRSFVKDLEKITDNRLRQRVREVILAVEGAKALADVGTSANCAMARVITVSVSGTIGLASCGIETQLSLSDFCTARTSIATSLRGTIASQNGLASLNGVKTRSRMPHQLPLLIEERATYTTQRDDTERAAAVERLREHMPDSTLLRSQIEGFPIGEGEAILTLSDPLLSRNRHVRYSSPVERSRRAHGRSLGAIGGR